MIVKVKGLAPHVPKSAFVHKNATVTGNVVLGEYASIWPGASIRGDIEKITIGDKSNVQDNCVLHTTAGIPLIIGKGVVVGHNAALHACEIGDHSLIGIGAIVMDHAKIGKNSIVAAGALVTPGSEYPDGVLLIGAPAKVAREVSAEEMEKNQKRVANYLKTAKAYMETEEEL